MDLSKITFPTFVLEPRSMLERITDFMAHPDLMFGYVPPPSFFFPSVLSYVLRFAFWGDDGADERTHVSFCLFGIDLILGYELPLDNNIQSIPISLLPLPHCPSATSTIRPSNHNTSMTTSPHRSSMSWTSSPTTTFTSTFDLDLASSLPSHSPHLSLRTHLLPTSSTPPSSPVPPLNPSTLPSNFYSFPLFPSHKPGTLPRTHPLGLIVPAKSPIRNNVSSR